MKKFWHDPSIRASDITPETVYINRRKFLQLGAVALGSAALSACVDRPALVNPVPTELSPDPVYPEGVTDELGDALTGYKGITGYNNYYEFSLGKEEVARLAPRLQTSPWEVRVDGLVQNPKTYGIEDILARFPRQERIYRLRCVEGWSMVIPWMGFPLADLLKEAVPLADARYVKFTTLKRLEEMPGLINPAFPWPYTEGLRLDEAMHDLTLLSTGLYGKELPNQNGAPIRLVVPWKYGFKSSKSIVRIELVKEQPSTFWSSIAPQEYGFYSNVNPNKAHPRWSQETERRIGELKRRPTLMFNGYEKEVASLYTGMDLNTYY
ncbi:protein-methionine-sulfoxide reductase catalytic subunit MsrP [Leptolinea sp. HRD-7]|nr:protein-methionine-sulfoxide reductase catalytic subunit MsrP [Leptolinea sp. HRD-7]